MENIDPSWKSFYKISGVSQFIAALFFFFGLALTSRQIVAIGPTAERLEILAKQQSLLHMINFTFAAADIFAILGMLGVYLALSAIKKNLALTGTSLLILGAVLAVGVRFCVYAEVALAGQYLSAANESLRFGYIAAAQLMKSATDIGLFQANILIGVGGLIGGIAMLDGVFHKRTALVFIITNILYIIGFVSVMFARVFFPVILIACLMTIISMILIGLRLYAIGNSAGLGKS